MSTLPVEILKWDSEFFGRRIARVKTHSLTNEEMDKIQAWAGEEKIDCLYFLVGGAEIDSTLTAENNGFHFVDLRVTFTKDLAKPERSFIPNWHIRRAAEEDLASLKTMVHDAFQFSRFHVDLHFGHEKADQMYKVWIENDLREKEHHVWVIDVEGKLAAYTSVSLNNTLNAQIGLVGTMPAWRGKGLSLELQRFVSEELRNEGLEQVEVVTQGRNIPAQNLYQRSGYFVQSIDLWYHKWFK